mmetsp:Transcript_20818/g.57875  ORF Transcript_20818/g.57875 Transcript_20818/m.57875 type:complete len:210 (-) Transcript_20818:587-1216(-)
MIAFLDRAQNLAILRQVNLLDHVLNRCHRNHMVLLASKNQHRWYHRHSIQRSRSVLAAIGGLGLGLLIRREILLHSFGCDIQQHLGRRKRPLADKVARGRVRACVDGRIFHRRHQSDGRCDPGQCRQGHHDGRRRHNLRCHPDCRTDQRASCESSQRRIGPVIVDRQGLGHCGCGVESCHASHGRSRENERNGTIILWLWRQCGNVMAK